MNNLVGMKWGELTADQQEELLKNSSTVNGSAFEQRLKNGEKCIVDLTDILSVPGTFISNEAEDTIEIDDDAIIYNSNEGTSWKESRQNQYHARNNLKTFGYKLNKDLGDSFKQACEKKGISQAQQISKMMQLFIDEVSNAEN